MRGCDLKLSVGFVLAILIASQSVRLVLLSNDAPALAACGLPQDLMPAILLAIPCTFAWKGLRQLTCVMVLLVIAADLFLQLSAGVRLRHEGVVFLFDQMLAIGASPSRPATKGEVTGKRHPLALLMANFAMVPLGTVLSTCMLIPAVLLLARFSKWSIRVTPRRLLALFFTLLASWTFDKPCCRSPSPTPVPRFETDEGASGTLRVRTQPPTVQKFLQQHLRSARVECSSNVILGQSSNVLTLLAGSLWSVWGGSWSALEADAARNLTAISAKLSARALRINEHRALRRQKRWRPLLPLYLSPSSNKDRRKYGNIATASNGAPPKGGKNAEFQPPPRTRNVVLITLESVGALYMDLYNPEAKTMPFVSSLFNSSPEGAAMLFERYYVSEPNTVHALYAELCGLRPYIGLERREYEYRRRLERVCLPVQLRKRGIHSAFYTTSNIGFQRRLGFDEFWSGEDLARRTRHLRANWAKDQARGGDRQGSKEWPRQWWLDEGSDALLPGGAGDKRRNWLGHHDAFGLPAVRDFISARGEDRFFLHLSTLGTHHPYRLTCPLPVGESEGRHGGKAIPSFRRSPFGVLRNGTKKWQRRQYKRFAPQRAILERYLQSLLCADRYIEQVYLLLQRAGRLHDTSIVITADHGEGFQLTHGNDLIHGGAVYETQARLPWIGFGPIAYGLPKRMGGVWSDVSMTPTLVEAMIGPVNDNAEQLRREQGSSTHVPSPPGRAGEGNASAHLDWPLASVSEYDLVGHSMLSGAPPPTQAFMSCAFDSTCLGLLVEDALGVLHKFVWHIGSQDNLFEAYKASAMAAYLRRDHLHITADPRALIAEIACGCCSAGCGRSL